MKAHLKGLKLQEITIQVSSYNIYLYSVVEIGTSLELKVTHPGPCLFSKFTPRT